MKELEEKILKDGKVINNSILKVDSFLNYFVDTKILRLIAKDIVAHFKGEEITKVLTVEASGIAFGTAVALELGDVPLVFAKKTSSAVNVDDNNYYYLVHSFTHNVDNNIFVKNDFISQNDKVLIVDDFMAQGAAAIGLVNICKQAKAKVVGIGIAVEKEFQGARARLNSLGYKVVSCARIKEFKDNKVIFNSEEC